MLSLHHVVSVTSWKSFQFVERLDIKTVFVEIVHMVTGGWGYVYVFDCVYLE